MRQAPQGDQGLAVPEDLSGVKHAHYQAWGRVRAFSANRAGARKSQGQLQVPVGGRVERLSVAGGQGQGPAKQRSGAGPGRAGLGVRSQTTKLPM